MNSLKTHHRDGLSTLTTAISSHHLSIFFIYIFFVFFLPSTPKKTRMTRRLAVFGQPAHHPNNPIHSTILPQFFHIYHAIPSILFLGNSCGHASICSTRWCPWKVRSSTQKQKTWTKCNFVTSSALFCSFFHFHAGV